MTDLLRHDWSKNFGEEYHLLKDQEYVRVNNSFDFYSYWPLMMTGNGQRMMNCINRK